MLTQAASSSYRTPKSERRMAESKPPSGVEKSSSLKNLKQDSRGDSPSGKTPSALNRNPSQKAGDLSPLQAAQKEGSQGGSSIKRQAAQRSKRGSEESGSPSRRAKGGGVNEGLGAGRQATKVSSSRITMCYNLLLVTVVFVFLSWQTDSANCNRKVWSLEILRVCQQITPRSSFFGSILSLKLDTWFRSF